VPVHQLETLPDEIVNLNLETVETHLRTSGALAVRFGWREGESEMVLVGEGDGVVAGKHGANLDLDLDLDLDQDGNALPISTTFEQEGHIKDTAITDSQVQGENGEEPEEDPTSSVPEIFFNPQFDLTDVKTFESLLVFDVDDDEEEGRKEHHESENNNNNIAESPNTGNNTSNDATTTNQHHPDNRNKRQPQRQQQPQPTPSPVRIPKPPAKLTQDLDTIELALLNQVRSKSDSFFRETNRFSYLKSLVAESVEQVQSLRSYLRVIRERSIDSVELIPIMDRKRSDMMALENILEEIMDVVEVKGSVAGLIAAGDYLGAVEAIYMARTLLNGDGFVQDDGDIDRKDGEDGKNAQLQNADATVTDTTTNAANTTMGGGPKRYVLGKLVALSKVSDQLAQFENLVVMDLSNELVEILLTWDESGRMSPSSAGNSSFFPDNDAGAAAAAASAVILRSSNGSSTPPNNSSVTSPLATTGSANRRAERRTKVKNTVKALQKCQKLSSVADAYRDKLCDTIRMTVRTTVSECAADAAKDATLLPSSTSASASTATGVNAADVQHTQQHQPKSSITEGITSMTFEQFMECLNMIFEQVLALLQSAAGVSKFFLEEGILLKDGQYRQASLRNISSDRSTSIARNRTDLSGGGATDTSMASSLSPSAVFSASDLSHKSLTELLRLRKEAHSLVSFEEMKRLWDSCLAFTLQVEKFSGQKAYSLRSTLLSQAKAFVERRHEGNMSSLVATLDGERWTQCDVSAERQATLHRLCSGRAVLPSSRTASTGSAASNNANSTSTQNDTPYVIIEGKRFRAVWSCLLLVEMIMHNVSCAAHFQTLATNAVSKTTELLRRFNSRATQLVLGAGAIHSAARLKSINAKHLALVTQCVGVVLAILPHVRAALMAQLPSKQHGLLGELDKIKKEYLDHSEMVLSKFVNIIGGIVEHGLAPRIAKINFDKRAKSLGAISQRQQQHAAATSSDAGNVDASGTDGGFTRVSVACCPFLEGVNTNTKKMHQVLLSNLPAEDLTDVFSRIFAYLDSNMPKLFIKADSDDANPFKFPITDEGKCRMIMEVEEMAITLNSLSNVRPWDFAAMKFLERRLDVLFYADDNTIVSTPMGGLENSEAPPVENKGDAQELNKNVEGKQVDKEGKSSENQAEKEEDKNKKIIQSQHDDRVVPMNGDNKIETKEQCDDELKEQKDATLNNASSATINITEHKCNNGSGIQDCGGEGTKARVDENDGTCSKRLPLSATTQTTIENSQVVGNNIAVDSGVASGTSIIICDDNGHQNKSPGEPSHVAPEDKQEGIPC